MLDINMKFKKGVLNVCVKGYLTSDTAYILEEEFDKITKRCGEKYVLLNLKDVLMIDKEGIDIIKKCYQKITNKNGKFLIYGIDKIFENDVKENDYLYQINEEEEAYDIVKL